MSIFGEPVMHRGWKQIARRIGVADVRTARKFAKLHHLPIYYMGRSPVLDEPIFRVWIAENIALRGEDTARKKEHEPV